MGLKKFTKPKFLEQIGRAQVCRLLEKYQAEFERLGVILPNPTLNDAEFYKGLAALALSQEGLPESFVEALYGIEALANAYGKERLLRAMAAKGLNLPVEQRGTYGDFVVEVLLVDPALFSQQVDEVRISGLSSFDYYACDEPADRRATFAPPDADGMARIKADIDAWLADQREGDERVTEVELHTVDGEYWFLVRRGDSFARIPTVEGGVFTVRHFRPARDLVVTYSPERDELRVHARSAGERKMLRQVFAERLFGDPDHFSVKRAFTLNPLRTEGPDALQAPAGCGIEKIVLTNLVVRTSDEHDGKISWSATDVFEFARVNGQRLIPGGAELVSAGFQVHFTGPNGQTKPRMVYLQAGNRLRLTRHCDAAAVHRWLTEQGFRSPEVEGLNRIRALSSERVERN